jgi:glycosyltransferase involved in cell wall biosynthesis
MIYQEQDLLPEITAFIRHHPGLDKGVSLLGWKSREEMATWYSAADFYISASHMEGSGYALLEALACGCVPVVSDIPPFRKITREGHLALLFQAGDPQSLLACLKRLAAIDLPDRSEAIREHFTRELSFQAIADKLTAVVRLLVAK